MSAEALKNYANCQLSRLHYFYIIIRLILTSSPAKNGFIDLLYLQTNRNNQDHSY